jgi:hypothetical protein
LVTLLLFFYTADFIHYAYVHQRLNASILSYIDNPLISLQMMWQSYHVVIIFLAFILIEFILYKFISFTYFFSNKYTSILSGWKKMSIQVLFFLVLVYSAIGNIIYEGGQYPLRWSDAYSLGSDYKANVALNPMQSFFSSLNFRSSSIDTDFIKKNYSVIAQYLSIPIVKQDEQNLRFSRINAAIENDTVAPKLKNVVLVICESFSAYKSSMMGNPLNTTPYFNSMKKQGVYFNRAFSPAYGTARGVWAVLTGTPDILEGKTFNLFSHYEKELVNIPDGMREYDLSRIQTYHDSAFLPYKGDYPVWQKETFLKNIKDLFFPLALEAHNESETKVS